MQHELTSLCQQVTAAREAGVTLRVQGGNTKKFYGEPELNTANIKTLDLSNYTGVLNYQPSELVITARAGTLLSEIEQVLHEQNQMLAFEPPRFGANSTLGGCIAAGLAGPRRIAAGGVSDFVLGARLLDSNGALLSFGGEVMKNVAGYDVSRLLAGSMGSLGPVVELSVKVMPKPAYEQTQVLEINQQQALEKFNAWRSLPLAISATAWIADSNSSGHLYVRISGSHPAVADTAKTIGGNTYDKDQATALWHSLRDQTHNIFDQKLLWRIAVPPTTTALSIGSELIEWNGGLRWLSTDMPASELRAKVAKLGGHATLYKYNNKPDDVTIFHPMPKVLEQINRRMMQQLDPSGLFNTGRLLPVQQG